MGAHPTIIIQPVSVSCGIFGWNLRSSTVPHAQTTAAPRIISAANGRRSIARKSSPRSTSIPAIPSVSPTSLRRPSGSRSTASDTSVAHTGIV